MFAVTETPFDTHPPSPRAAGAGGPLSPPPPLRGRETPSTPCCFSPLSPIPASPYEIRELCERITRIYSSAFEKFCISDPVNNDYIPSPDQIEVPLYLSLQRNQPLCYIERDKDPQAGLLLTNVDHLSGAVSFAAVNLSKEAERLGSGISATVYRGIMLSIDSTDNYAIFPVAVSCIAKPELYHHEAAWHILSSIKPRCKQLLAVPDQPYGIFQHPSKPGSPLFITMPYLSEPPLFDLSHSGKLNYTTLCKGIKNASKALARLHPTYVHKDLTLRNMLRKGTIDYQTITRAGWSPVEGATLIDLPPELIFYMKDRVDCPPYIDRFRKWYGDAVLSGLATQEVRFNEKDHLIANYTPAVDIFILGMQIISCFNDEHPSTWKVEKDPRVTPLRDFVTRMIAFNPEERPTAAECIPFFKNLEELFASAEALLEYPQAEILSPELAVARRPLSPTPYSSAPPVLRRTPLGPPSE